MTSTAQRIKNAVRARGITALYHFTPASNLESILENGLHSRETLDQNNAPYTYTDEWRRDGNLDAVSVSIHGINQDMFQAKLANSRCRWMILEIEPSILWTHYCYFCWVNAASNEILKHRGRRDGFWGFNEMFEDVDMGHNDPRSRRGTLQIPLNMPTWADAEVQVFDPIAPELIRDVTSAHECDRKPAEAAMARAGREIPIAIYPDIFKLS